LEELRRLVEEGAVVFIAFDDEVASLADAVARSLRSEVERNPNDQHRWSEAALRQQPSCQRCRGRLAVRAGQDDRSGPPQEVVANRFRQRAITQLALENRLELRVTTRDGIAHHCEVDICGDV